MLAFHDVHKSFGAVVAIDGLSLQVEPGEVFGLLGPNGAGKTTLVALSTGLLPPDRGRIELAGGAPGAAGSPMRASVRASLGLCPQRDALYDGLTAIENLTFFGSLYGMPRGVRARRAAALLDRVGLTDRGAHRVETFSGGMRRRLSVAAGLMHDPPFLLLDEPTAGVDPHSRHAIFELVRSLQADGRTVLYTTHYMEEAQQLCDRVGIIDHGRLLACGTVDALIDDHGGVSVVTIERAAAVQRIETEDPIRELSRLDLRDGHPAPDGVTGVRIDRPSLEAVFLNLTGRSLRD